MHSSYFQLRRAKKRRPFHERELIYSVSEIARTLLVTPQSVYRYRRDFPDFPKLITSKAAVTHWARRHGIPRKRGPLPSEIRRVVVRMREQGKTFREIGKVLRISHQAVQQQWGRHLRGKYGRS
jgi:transposase-like protein